MLTMKKYYLFIVMLFCGAVLLAQQQAVTSTISVIPFKAYETLNGEAKVVGQSFRAVGNDLYTIFDVEANMAGAYYLSAWMLGAGRQDGSTIAYDVLVNERPTGLAMKPQAMDWQNVYASRQIAQPLSQAQSLQQSNVIVLVQGRNTIAFKGQVPVVPTVEQIALSRQEGVKAVSETAYQAFKAQVAAMPTDSPVASVQGEPALPLQNPDFAYDYDLDFEYRYTSYIRCYFSSAGNVMFATADATTDHVVSLFSYTENNYSEHSSVFTVENIEGAVLEATISAPGMYCFLLRTKSPNGVGTVDFLIEDGSLDGATYFNDLPISCSRMPITHGTIANSDYVTFLQDATSSNAPIMTLEDDLNNPTKVLGYNSVYNRAGFNAIDLVFSISPKVVYVSGGTSSNPTQTYTGKLYAHVKKEAKESVASMPWDDIYLSSNGTDGFYNCFSWVGGVVDEPWASSVQNSKLDPYGGELDNFLSNTDKNGNTLLRYQGATTYTLISDQQGKMVLNLNDPDAVIDLYGGVNSTDTAIGHAAIRDGSDTNPHGPSWESKLGTIGNRRFHIRNSILMDNAGYGVVVGHYKRASVQKSAVEMSMYESLAQGLSVIENPQITKTEKAALVAMKANVPPVLEVQFTTQMQAFNAVVRQREINFAARRMPCLRHRNMRHLPPYIGRTRMLCYPWCWRHMRPINMPTWLCLKL